MKRIFFLLLFFSISLIAADDGNEAVLKSLGESSGGAAGAFGLGMVHGLFLGPILLALLIAALIIGVYYRTFKQKDDGVWKTIGFFILAIIAAVLVYIGCLKVIDGLFKSDGCGSDIATAYLKDSIKKGLNPSSQFGNTLKGLSCLQ